MGESDKPVIDSHGPRLVYMVIADHIAAQVAKGELVPGARIPGELDLAASYGVARMTVSRAVRELRERGLVITVRGKGTFVAERPPANPTEGSDPS